MASYTPSERMNAEAPGPDTAEAHIGDLAGEIFLDHPANPAWEALQGDQCKPWELATLESRAGGDSRHQAATMSPEWNSTIIVKTPVTRAQGPDGKHKSNLPNHSQYTE